MKIACIGPFYPYRGGIAAFNGRLTSELSRMQDCININFTRFYPDFLFPGKTQYDESSKAPDLKSERMIDSVNWFSWLKTGKYIGQSNVEALIFHWWHPFFAPAYRAICRYANKSAVKLAVCHNVYPHSGKAGVMKKMAKLFLNRLDGAVIHSKTEAADLDRINKRLKRIRLFHPLYDVFPGSDMDKLEARKRLNLDSHDRIILYFGLIRRYKGVDILLKALDETKNVKNLKCLIVGEVYDNREYIKSLIGNLPAGSVRLIDRYIPNEDVAVYFRACDVVALPYRSATQSGIVPIAYQCERPVIASNIGGLPDAVEDGVTGLLAPSEDPHALAEAVNRFFIELDAPSMLAGIKRKKKELSWENYASQLTGFITELKDARK